MREEITTLRKLLTEQLNDNNETWDDIEALEISIDRYSYEKDEPICEIGPFISRYETRTVSELTDDEKIDIEFDSGYGADCPIKILAWTKGFVYYSHEYDGADSIESVPRNPPKEEEK